MSTSADDRSHHAHAAAAPAPHSGASQVDPRSQRERVVEAQKQQFGGMKLGSAFFGWLTATGTAVLLTALLAAAGTAVGLATDADPGQLTSGAAADPGTIGVVGGVAVLVVLLVAYFCGGYVAGRMARFNGMKQGLAVWLWAVVIAVLVAVLGLVAGSQFNILGQLNSFPRIPVDEGTLSTGAVITVVAAALVALVGALLGGLAGMRFHRRVDRATLAS
ncbi:hypothetical protein [Streptomyces sp. NP160]|uniref:hypothetical protein n=1 Tax=Streptomyces sp. NP160 TaxID=2586637 RepID=UPI001C5746B0|nr:hypothetical protein [Streptomyces sp. NP160]